MMSHSFARGSSTTLNSRPLRVLPGLMLLAAPVLLFWRSGFFFIIDDWTTLLQMTEFPFGQYVFKPDAEIWFPVFHAVYFGLIKAAGRYYDVLVLVNCLITGISGLLVFAFFQRHFSYPLALALAFLYTVAAVHAAVIWNTFYLCYILCLVFFMGALLVTDRYVRAPSRSKLLGVWVGAGLAVLSHNYIVVGLWSLPLYALLLGGSQARRQALALAAVVMAVSVPFAAGYLIFAGAPAATSHDPRILTQLPSSAYLIHLVNGSVLAPFFYLFWGHYHFPVWAIAAGVTVLLASLFLIWWAGEPQDRRLGLWALGFNILPFFLISLARYHRSINQAFGPRYGIFTLIGALLLVGTAWSIADRRWSGKWWQTFSWGVLALMLAGQLLALPRWQHLYREMSQAAQHCYQALGRAGNGGPAFPEKDFRKFCPTAHPVLSRQEVVAVRHLLEQE